MSEMAIEQVIILTLVLMFAVIHGLVRAKRGIGNATNTNVPPASDWETNGRVPDPFEAADVEPIDVEPPKFEDAQAPHSVPQQHRSREASKPLARTRSRSAALPAQPRSLDAGLRETGLLPQNDAELRRTMALVVIFGPPRALDPPR